MADEYVKPPSWAEEYFGKKNCKVFGNLIVCVQGTSKLVTPETLFTGKYGSKIKVCFANLRNPDEYWCVRVVAPPTSVGKAIFDQLASPDPSEADRGGRSVVRIADYPSNVGFSLDRAGFKERNAEYTEVAGVTGEPSAIAIRVHRGPGEGIIERRDFLRY